MQAKKTHVGTAALGAALTEAKHLEVLRFQGCSGMGDGGIESLASGLPDDATLWELHVDRCAISNVGGVHLIGAFPRCPQLRFLGAEGNIMGAAGKGLLRAAAMMHPQNVRLYLEETDEEA